MNEDELLRELAGAWLLSRTPDRITLATLHTRVVGATGEHGIEMFAREAAAAGRAGAATFPVWLPRPALAALLEEALLDLPIGRVTLYDAGDEPRPLWLRDTIDALKGTS
ncbi:hypothetical protein GobsT_13430 [Gemmata obscuriglobus]|uniref:Uncharacterized protein n=1 Tax=Gemmata obscuriglobus TaxID=114 RepID=A0A2Z3HFP2_9BACT|nr:hypothetical protein [Gemmata obscuriglobus]AWM40210.1 hypothetical protein C1280_26535 [Gemmata obscuriglobus]QEG26600.1 hypothetical protein GobsT_13430 [Gemmata obscuriglobus]VTS02089.1 unnamed protein product [Gemmata obscuriglobus UQM 2246]